MRYSCHCSLTSGYETNLNTVPMLSLFLKYETNMPLKKVLYCTHYTTERIHSESFQRDTTTATVKLCCPRDHRLDSCLLPSVGIKLRVNKVISAGCTNSQLGRTLDLSSAFRSKCPGENYSSYLSSPVGRVKVGE